MAIFGRGYPVITSSDDAGVAFTDYVILYCDFMPDYENRKEIENVSPINGEKTFVPIYNHMKFKIIPHLHLFADPKVVFDELSELLNHDVFLKVHKYNYYGEDSNYLKADNEDYARFHCTKFEASDGLNDVIDIRLKSREKIKITNIESLLSYTWDQVLLDQ